MTETVRVKKPVEESSYLSAKEAKQMQAESADEQRRNEKLGKTATREEILNDVDDLLDEIEEVLEENASEFVKNYRQVGGQ